MFAKLKIGNVIYNLDINDFKFLSYLYKNEIITLDRIYEIKHIKSINEDKYKVLLYDFLGAKLKKYKNLLKIEDIDFYKKYNLYYIYKYLEILKYSKNSDFLYEIAKTGELKFIKLAKNNGYIFDEKACFGAIVGGHLDCLKYLQEKILSCSLNENCFKLAIKFNNLDCLKYLYEIKCPIYKPHISEVIYKTCYKFLLDNDLLNKKLEGNLLSVDDNFRC